MKTFHCYILDYEEGEILYLKIIADNEIEAEEMLNEYSDCQNRHYMITKKPIKAIKPMGVLNAKDIIETQ
jgi:hypothetical protein